MLWQREGSAPAEPVSGLNNSMRFFARFFLDGTFRDILGHVSKLPFMFPIFIGKYWSLNRIEFAASDDRGSHELGFSTDAVKSRTSMRFGATAEASSLSSVFLADRTADRTRQNGYPSRNG